MSRKRPRLVRGRAPWRWHWGRIVLMVLGWWAWALLLGWSAFFGIALSLWVGLQLMAQDPHPLPSPTEEEGPEDKEAGQFVFTQDDPDRPNHWKVQHGGRDGNAE